MPITSPIPPKVHSLGIVLTPRGSRFLCCKDCKLAIEIAEGSDAAMRAARNRATTIACTNIPNAFSSDWRNRRGLGAAKQS